VSTWIGCFAPVVAGAPYDLRPIGYALTLPSDDTSPLVFDVVWIDFLPRDQTADDLMGPQDESADFMKILAGEGGVNLGFGTDETLDFDPFSGLSDALLVSMGELFPSSASLWMEKSRRAYRSGELDQSFRHAERAIQLDPGNVDYYNYFSGILVMSGRYELATDLLQDALFNDPYNVILRFNLACALSLAGQLDAAVRNLQTLDRMGWDNLLFYLGDSDLDPLRSHPDFLAMENQLLDRRARLGGELNYRVPPLEATSR
jgi:tetratricopeptide (TPR) repeat protein